jgi:AraC family L-rhamnose operon regulatory protein RhaS
LFVKLVVSHRIPVFELPDETCQADSCRSLVEAAGRGEIDFAAFVHGHYPGSPLPPHALPGLKTIGFWDARHVQNWGLDWHRNEGIELTFCSAGSLDFASDNGDFELGTNDLTITRPWQRHRVGNPWVGPSRLHWVIVDLGVRRPDQAWRWPAWIVLSREDIQDLTRLLRHNEHPVVRSASPLRDCFERMAAAVRQGNVRNPQSAFAVLLNELFLQLLTLLRECPRPLDPSLSDRRRTVQMLLDELQQNEELLGQEWCADSMAAACGLGGTQFSKYCKELVNLTPIQFLQQARLEAAARMLRERTDLTVTQIAQRTGFSSGQYFATLFRHRFGAAPSQSR